MIAEKENDIHTATNKNRKQSLSETTIRKVFFSSLAPSCLFSPTIITAKGLYPPPVIILKALLKNTIPTKSLSAPIRLITMKEHPPDKENTNKLKKSSSTPSTTIKKPTLIERLISPTKSETSTIRKAPRPSTSTRSVPIQTKSNNRPLIHNKKKKPTATEDEEDEPMTKPISLTEKRKRQAKRADQVKSWKVREEREAREARLVLRRQIINGISKIKPTESTTVPKKMKKKRVKFNFDKNSIIQLPTLLDNEDVT
jgi:hypothetical protein